MLHEHVGDDEVRVDDAGHAHPAAGDLLDDQGVREQRLAQPAVLLGDHQAEDAELLEALDDVGGVLVLVLQLGGDRQDLLLDELADDLEDLLLLLGQTFGGGETTHGNSSVTGESEYLTPVILSRNQSACDGGRGGGRSDGHDGQPDRISTSPA